MTGGDRITTRFLFKEYFEFQPRFKLWIAANHKPVINGTDHAIWRRIRLIPFNVTISESEKDKHLADKLKAELPGILAWVVRGCLEWQANGLQEPPEVIAATESYREEMDILGEFLREKTSKKPSFSGEKPQKTPVFRVLAGVLYHAYEDWCHENGETPISQRMFGRRMTERGFARSRAANGQYQYVGIGLIATEHSEVSEQSEANSGKFLHSPDLGTNTRKLTSETSETSEPVQTTFADVDEDTEEPASERPCTARRKPAT